MIEELGRRESLTDEQIVTFLAAFNLPVPTVIDDGAVAGVRRLLREVTPKTPLVVRVDFTAALRTYVVGDAATMTRAEEAATFAALDAHVRTVDPELWRAKQVSDFLAGVWAQGYGQIYLDGINGFFRIQRGARVTCVATVLALAAVPWTAKRRVHEADPTAAVAVERPPNPAATA